MRLGIFGGTFDPVHYGHLLLAECCREQCRLDAVWFLPAATAPHKQDREITPAAQRIEMLELAIAGNEAFSVCRYEADRGGVNYTADTLEHFHADDADRQSAGILPAESENGLPAESGRDARAPLEMFLLLGADMLADLPAWRRAERVCELAIPVAVCRPGCPATGFDTLLRGIASPERIEEIRRHQVEMPEIGISGTELRRRVQSGLTIRYQTPRAVEMYIATQGLYRSPTVE
jgi:nicotinate-nucleotide adenylyltransferase